MIKLSALLLAAVLLSACGPAPAPHTVTELSGATMGTTYSVKVVDLPGSVDVDSLRSDVDGVLRDINAMMSTYDPASELSRFNTHAGNDWFAVSPEVVEVIMEARRVSELSGGRFDVTVGPLVELWGFGAPDTGNAVPSDQAVRDARARVGFEKLDVRMQPPGLRKTEPGLHVDLSAIAKGYAVDRVSALLASRGLAHHLVEIGGELRGRGMSHRAVPWRIGVERPDATGRSVYAAVNLADRGMATSGDYRNFFEREGQRYSHTMDPRTGRPVRSGLASVTVVADTCMSADALATALMALGPVDAFALAEQEGIAAFFIERTDTGFRDRATRAYAQLTLGAKSS
ncbi:MAG: FAD:protein FMN transferase [Gammaproteobacteria bacterium]